MAKLLISFATGKPGDGSEAGVGWSFVEYAAKWANRHDEQVSVVIDARDLDTVQQGVLSLGEAGSRVTVVPVSVPGQLLRRYGNSRSRQTYLGWRRGAMRAVQSLVRSGDFDVVHQVTFATATMPAAIPKTSAKSVWGPVAVPSGLVAAQGALPSVRERLGVAAARRLAGFNARDIDLMLANNEATQIWVSKKNPILEPNIFLRDLPQIDVTPRGNQLVVSGLLDNRKRPWLALQAMLDPALRDFTLVYLGTGPLASSLMSFARQERLESRVTFLGKVPRDEALRTVAQSRVLVHPAVREGSAWAVGEAAALGVPAVAVSGTGADTIVRLSGGHGIVPSSSSDMVGDLARTVARTASEERPIATDRWAADRLLLLLDQWWEV